MINKYELALDEIKNNYRLQCEGVEACKQSAQSSINSSALIIALISLIEKNNEDLLDFTAITPIFFVWILTILAFIAMIIIYVIAIRPINMSAPIYSSLGRFEKLFFKNSDEKSIKLLIVEYTDTIEENRPVLKKVSSYAKWANFLGVTSIIMAFLVYLASGFYS